jgi:hypothetical protein
MSWRDRILRDFPAEAYSLAVVSERQPLFADEQLQTQLSDRGYTLLFYDNNHEQFQQTYQQYKNQGLAIIAIISLAEDSNIFRKFPKEILSQASISLEYGLDDIFPNLNEIFLAKFAITEWEQLHNHIKEYPKQRLGEKATEKFLQETLTQTPLFPTSNPVTQLRAILKDLGLGYHLSPHYQTHHILTDQLPPIYAQLDRYLSQWQTQPPNHRDWLEFAPLFAEAIIIRHQISNAPAWQQQKQLDQLFLEWMHQNYDKLHNLSFAKSPIALHQVAPFLNRQFTIQSIPKIALIVFDGMGWDSWLILEKLLSDRHHRQYKIRRSSCFAMLPTLTSISRQAIFAGKLPKFYADHLKTTSKEKSHWQNFWLEQNQANPNFNGSKEAIAYLNVRGNTKDMSVIQETLAHPKQKILGLVVTKIDDIAHGMILGTKGLHQQIKEWSEQGFFTALIDLLSDRGYHIYITADHGMIEATGMGRINEGAFVEQRGERVRIYNDQALSQTARSKYPDALFWQSQILPTDCQPLFAPHRVAFVESGDRLMCHGGISIEEVIVPFIEISTSAAP